MAKKSKPNKKAKASPKAKPTKKSAPKKKVEKKVVAKKNMAKKAVKVKATSKPVKALKPVKTKPEKELKKVVPAVKEVAKVEVPIKTAPPIKVKKAGREPKPKKIKIKKIFVPFNPIQISSEKAATSKKEPKGKFEMEFVMRCSESLLYDFFTTPSGMSEWFADNVNIRDGLYTFIWEGSKQDALLIGLKEDSFARFQWVDKTDGSYFEFRIQTDDLTGDVSLIITDFAENKNDETSARLLWETQIEKLKKTIGSFT